jgi:hypothetical protein
MTFTPLSGETHNSTPLGTASLTLSLPLHAGRIIIQALTQNIRYTLDGTTPTAAIGFQLKAADPPREIEITSGMVMKFFREASGAVLEYEYGE